ncbi:MAG: tRNA lysidine(34) synthetase TilS [Ruminococcus sp.]
MNNQFIRTVEKYNMLQNGDSVIVALSGGADSVALLDILNSVKEKYNLTLYAVHINHGLRGEESLCDENFCKSLCKKYGVKLFVKHENISVIAKKNKISEELCGRNVRYSVFEELSNELSAKVATAHTASDNAETLLFNITRGASLGGVSAIPPVRDYIIRPLIECTRAQIEQYCKNKNLEYVTDSTNLTDDYTRNKIRHNVIPALKEINPAFENSALRLSENAREISDYLSVMTDKAIDESKYKYGYDCKALLSNHNAIVKNAVAVLCKRCADFTAEQRHIELIIDIIKNGGAVNLTKKYSAVSKQGILRFVFCGEENRLEEIKLCENTEFEYYGKTYRVKKDNSDKENKNSVNADYLNKNAVFRTRKSKDMFTYPKRKVTKPLRKVMNEMKIPSEQRDNSVVLAVDNIILWCEGVGVSAQGTAYNSENALKIEIFFLINENNVH